MNIWQSFEKKNCSDFANQTISFHFEKGIDNELKKLYLSFSKWLRKNYIFPININIYILNCEKVCLRNGQMSYGSFRWYPNKTPIIKIPSAVEKDLLNKYTPKDIYEQILSSLVHELTHYYQWALNLNQTNSTSERQANYYRYRIIEKYFNDINNQKELVL